MFVLASENPDTLEETNVVGVIIKNIYLIYSGGIVNEILPNKIIFSGNKGIGKSTFAYHLINYIFSQKEEKKYDFKNNTILSNNFATFFSYFCIRYFSNA